MSSQLVVSARSSPEPVSITTTSRSRFVQIFQIRETKTYYSLAIGFATVKTTYFSLFTGRSVCSSGELFICVCSERGGVTPRTGGLFRSDIPIYFRKGEKCVSERTPRGVATTRVSVDLFFQLSVSNRVWVEGVYLIYVTPHHHRFRAMVLYVTHSVLPHGPWYIYYSWYGFSRLMRLNASRPRVVYVRRGVKKANKIKRGGGGGGGGGRTISGVDRNECRSSLCRVRRGDLVEKKVERHGKAGENEGDR